MKKTVQIIAVLLVVLCIFTGCSQQGNSNNKDERVDVALAAIDEQWDNYQIKNTRIITIKDNTSFLNHGLMDSFGSRMPNSRINPTVNQQVVEDTTYLCLVHRTNH